MDKELKAILASLADSQQKMTQLLKNGGMQRKDISGTPDAQLIFGSEGIFSNAGLENTVINASISPRGMDGMIPAIGTRYIDPIYPYITGFEDDGSAEPAGVCDDAPGGVIEVCHQTAQAGRYTRSSKEIEANELMQIANGRLTTDMRVIGSVLGDGHALLPSQTNENSDWINYVVQTQMVIVGVLIQRLLSRQLWQGNPANNNVGGGYREFPGLDILVSTGKVDAISGVTCEALDSDVKDFGHNMVDGADPDIVTWISTMCRYLEMNAIGMGLDPVEWVMAMRPDLFWELTAVWPCRYMTHRCNTIDGPNIDAQPYVDSADMIRLRDEMRNGRYLVVNGRRYPVVLDDGIAEEDSQNSANVDEGEFASDIYVLPLRAANMPVLYWEYLDYSQISPQDLAVLNDKQRFFVTDSGRWMWAVQDKNWCFKLQGKIEPRVVLRTPQLAGRLQNVKYTLLQHTRSPFQDSPYFVKGGKEDYDDTTLYSDWNQPEQ